VSTSPPLSLPARDRRSSGEPKILGQLLLARSAIAPEELEAALRAQRDVGRRLGEILVERGACEEEEVARALATQLALPYAPPPLEPDPAAWDVVRPELARSRRVVPLRASARTLRLAMADPLDLDTVDDVRFQSGRRVEPAVATAGSVARALARLGDGALSALIDEIPGGEDDEESSEELERAARSTPIVRLVDHLLEDAIASRASDIHLQLRSGDLRVRFRIDGILRTAVKLPRASHASVVSRLKIMAGLDISVKRRPQDGSVRLGRGDDALTLRLSTLPVTGGEKAVLRILDPARVPRDLGALGLAPEDLERLRRLIGAGQGVILAAGPTGSGKSSTLFAAMAELDREILNVVTLEDPVEYRLEGASQVQVDPRSGLSFPAALRSVLRQDPDVVMVGEIRDRETAEIAMSAAVTGHLVLSTIHTTDAPGAVTRLLNMGVPPYLVAGGLAGVVAQRLVRRVCGSCQGRAGSGCGECPDGYRGRTGVFQLLVASDALRDEVIRGGSTEALRKLARAAGMGSLVEDARRKVVEGITTPHEAGRVIQADPGASLPCRACGCDVPTGALGCPRCGVARLRRCPCGAEVRGGWRFCPWCLRPVRG